MENRTETTLIFCCFQHHPIQTANYIVPYHFKTVLLGSTSSPFMPRTWNSWVLSLLLNLLILFFQHSTYIFQSYCGATARLSSIGCTAQMPKAIRFQQSTRKKKLLSWYYCPTDDNPADLLTRGLSTAQLSVMATWSKVAN